MEGWRECTLGDVCSAVITGGTPATTVAAYYEGGTIPWIKTKEVNFNRLICAETLITEEALKKSSAKIVPQNSVIIAMYGQGGTAGRVALNKIPVATNQACCNLVINGKYADYEFVFYYAWSKYEEFVLQKTGSAQPNLNTNIIKNFKIFLPNIKEQRAISAMLSSLDDKIDLLHRQNKTLEALAQTLFRQWFVEEADKKIGVLFDIIELSYGKALKEEMRSGAGFPVLGSNGIVGYHSEPLVKGPGIVIGRKGTLGNVFYIPSDFFPIDTTYYIAPKRQCTSMYYEYFLLKSLNFENSDSAVPGLNREIALSHEITIPKEHVVRNFESVCHVLFNKIHRNTRNIKTLTKLRDTLLPKLMSGEIRVEV